jgi:hypothetical protein
MVWHELREAGTLIGNAALLDDARAVCDEMARRARHNIEVIIERLQEQGFVFHTNDFARTPVAPHHPPGARVAEVHDWLTGNFEAVPLTLLAWLHHVGDVWLVGTHPDWPDASAADPLVIELEGSKYPDHAIVDYFDDELEAYEEQAEEGEPFVLPLAPDRLHKENISGGSPYGIVLPDGRADGTFDAEETMPFVEYLRWVFAGGGFPVGDGSPEGERIRRELAADLLPL